MIVALVLVHGHVGFFMNWGGQYPAGQEGFEYAPARDWDRALPDREGWRESVGGRELMRRR